MDRGGNGIVLETASLYRSSILHMHSKVEKSVGRLTIGREAGNKDFHLDIVYPSIVLMT